MCNSDHSISPAVLKIIIIQIIQVVLFVSDIIALFDEIQITHARIKHSYCSLKGKYYLYWFVATLNKQQ